LAKEVQLVTFRQNVEATIPALRRYARALTRDSDIADDLVQDTLVRALRSKHLFHGGEMRSWLYTILTNLNRNRLRSLSRRPMLMPLEDNDMPNLAGPESGGRDIERALATLVEDQRNALLLVVLEGLTYREVSVVQGSADRHCNVTSGVCARPNQNFSRWRAPDVAPRRRGVLSRAAFSLTNWPMIG
jgi:RNA polymerase sigma-70 factor (ECF subfamily)